MIRARSGAHGDKGAGTVLVLIVATLVLALAGWALVGALAAGMRQRAGAAADLAALAAAAHASLGTDAACAHADQVARANGAHVESCDLSEGAVADVVVAIDARGAFAAVGPARGRARAGPAP